MVQITHVWLLWTCCMLYEYVIECYAIAIYSIEYFSRGSPVQCAHWLYSSQVQCAQCTVRLYSVHNVQFACIVCTMYSSPVQCAQWTVRLYTLHNVQFNFGLFMDRAFNFKSFYILSYHPKNRWNLTLRRVTNLFTTRVECWNAGNKKSWKEKLLRQSHLLAVCILASSIT